MYAYTPRRGTDFSRRCAGRKIGNLFFATHPHPGIREWFCASTHCLWQSSPQRIFIHCSNVLCLAISRRVEYRSLTARTVVGLCRMLDMDFGEFPFHALG